MISVIKGDIIASRKLENPDLWLQPLKAQFKQWGNSPRNWQIIWGDSFQLEIKDPAGAFLAAVLIKALIRGIQTETDKQISSIDVRMAIGIGDKTFDAKQISESNGSAFINSGTRFEYLKKERRTLLIQSPWPDLDEDLNLYFRLACTFMDSWSLSSAELVKKALQHPEARQEQLGKLLGIKQNSVSGRWTRANMDEVLALDQHFRKKINQYAI